MFKTVIIGLSLFSYLLFGADIQFSSVNDGHIQNESQQHDFYGEATSVERGAYRCITARQKGHFHKSDGEWAYLTHCPFSCGKKFEGPNYDELKAHLMDQHRIKFLSVESFVAVDGGPEKTSWQIIYQRRVSK